MSQVFQKGQKQPGVFKKRPPRRYNPWRFLAWLLCGVLFIYMLILNFQQSYFSFFETLILLSILIAMLNTRLADPAFLVNRSLIYSVFGTCLVLILLVGTYILNFLLPPKGVLRVLILVFIILVFILSSRLRTRIQVSIDRRFYRRQADAAAAFNTFVATLREEIDLDQLSEHLLTVVQNVIQPQFLALWLRHDDTANLSAATFIKWQQKMETNMQTIGGVLSKGADYNATLQELEKVSIPLNDPIANYLLKAPDLVELDRLNLASPVLHAMQKQQIKILLPLVNRGELIGWLNLGPHNDEHPYEQYELRLLNTLASHVASALRVAQMVLEQHMQARARERIAQELRTAQFIQQTLLPKSMPTLPGWHVTAYYKPAWEVGGDFYDFISFEDGRLGFVIGDATDKGVPAALVMAMARSMIITAAQKAFSPGEVLRQVNDLLYSNIPARMFVTCFYAVLDPRSGQLDYPNAGQDWPYQQHFNGGCELRATGMPLGMLPGTCYDEQTTTLQPGDSLLFYSDGLVEAHNSQRVMFGTPHLTALLKAHLDNTTLIDYLLNELATFTGGDWEQEDDVTMVVLHRSASSS